MSLEDRRTMSDFQTQTDTSATIAAKLSPPATVAAKLSPPATVLGAQLAGIPVADWIQILTVLYLLLLISHKCWGMVLEAYRFWRGTGKS